MIDGRQSNDAIVDDAGVWLDVVAAVDHLSVTDRLGLTVWEAVEEAVRWWTADRLIPPGDIDHVGYAELPWDDPDPLRSTLERLLAVASPAGTLDGAELGEVVTAALVVWVDRMARRHNDGHIFAHPQPRRGWPSPTLSSDC
jgi:hypothetical protein